MPQRSWPLEGAIEWILREEGGNRALRRANLRNSFGHFLQGEIETIFTCLIGTEASVQNVGVTGEKVVTQMRRVRGAECPQGVKGKITTSEEKICSRHAFNGEKNTEA